jgi:hypothetical protein
VKIPNDDHEKSWSAFNGHVGGAKTTRLPRPANPVDHLVAVLGDDVTPFSMDRRGPASARTPGHSNERDFEDVATIVDAVASAPAGPSHCGAFRQRQNAMGGAALSDNIHHLVLDEPTAAVAALRNEHRPTR